MEGDEVFLFGTYVQINFSTIASRNNMIMNGCHNQRRCGYIGKLCPQRWQKLQHTLDGSHRRPSIRFARIAMARLRVAHVFTHCWHKRRQVFPYTHSVASQWVHMDGSTHCDNTRHFFMSGGMQRKSPTE